MAYYNRKIGLRDTLIIKFYPCFIKASSVYFIS